MFTCANRVVKPTKFLGAQRQLCCVSLMCRKCPLDPLTENICNDILLQGRSSQAGSLRTHPGPPSVAWSVSRQPELVKTFVRVGRRMESKWQLGPRNKTLLGNLLPWGRESHAGLVRTRPRPSSAGTIKAFEAYSTLQWRRSV